MAIGDTLDSWFDDFNPVDPETGLSMRSDMQWSPLESTTTVAGRPNIFPGFNVGNVSAPVYQAPSAAIPAVSAAPVPAAPAAKTSTPASTVQTGPAVSAPVVYSGASVPTLSPASLASLFSTFMPKTPTVPSATDLAKTALAAMQAQAASNKATVQQNVQQATSLGTATAAQIDDMIRQRTLEMYKQLNPNWQSEVETGAQSVQNAQAVVTDYLKNFYAPSQNAVSGLAATAAATATPMLRGEIPADVLAQIRRASAETAGVKQGTFGEAPAGSMVRNLVARDLGLTSLDVIGKGEALAKTSSDLYGRLADLSGSATSLAVAPGTAASAQLSTMRNLTPQTALTAAPALIEGLANTLNNATTISPSTVGSLYQGAQSTANQLAEVVMGQESDARVSAANAALSLYKLANNMSGAKNILGPIA